METVAKQLSCGFVRCNFVLNPTQKLCIASQTRFRIKLSLP